MRRTTTIFMLAAMLLAGAAVAIAAERSTTAVAAQRLSGEGRRDTAIAISNHAFPDGALEVYISNEQVNPDALVGGALTKGPILLVPQCGALPPEVATEIERLAPFRVYALGGSVAVCQSMLDQAAAAAPAPADRPPQTITKSDNGGGATDTFELVGGSYAITYDYEADCFYGPFLEAIDGQGLSESLPSGTGPQSDTTMIHNVEPGRYAIDMNTGDAGCPWTITLTNE